MTYVRLAPLSGPARSKAVATSSFTAGTTLLSEEALCTLLLDDHKSLRCDHCHRVSPRLQRCTGCAAYFYCGTQCQTLQWNLHHKKICKRINKFTAGTQFQALAQHERNDSMLLSHLVAQLECMDDAIAEKTALARVMDLLPGPDDTRSVVPVVFTSRLTAHDAESLHARFGNNNFVIHSHLNTFGHGIFTSASRYFNHSCLPNAVVKYILAEASLPRMEVVAIKDISEGEEICLPYLDPALIQSRQQAFRFSYGFQCRCPSCLFLERTGRIPEPSDQTALARDLLQFARSNRCDSTLLTSSDPDETLPPELLPVLHESFIAQLAETFRNASHDGSYQTAFTSGETLLALYRLIYPENYPQIGKSSALSIWAREMTSFACAGLHLLELAKTYWNGLLAQNLDTRRECLGYLSEAKAILSILGPEGDEGGPLVEISTLDSLLLNQ